VTDLAHYRAYWHPLAHETDVTSKPRRFMLLGEELVAFRTEAGVSVFKDLCIHRGSALSLGRVENGTIECPYHGWRYDSTGKCVDIPALDRGAPIPAKARAIAYQTRSEGGVVWVAMEEPKAPFPEWPEGTALGTPGVSFMNVAVYEWDVDAGRAVENFLDVAHFPFIHEGTLGTRDRVTVHAHDIDHDDASMRFSYLAEEPADPSTGHGEVMDLQYNYHAPFTVHLKRQTPHEDWSVMSLLASPTSETTSRLFVSFARNFDIAPGSDQTYIDFTHLVMNEDKAVVQSVHPERIPIDLREELHIKVPDAAGMIFRRILGRIEGLNRAVA
jgi:phenylpropionate dioxygenase-like ring-hydroxylating dioxygenase large terminal subunit